MKSLTPVRDLTAEARAGLTGNWAKSIGVVIVYMILTLAVGLVPLVGPLLQVLFQGPLIVGFYAYFLTTVRGGDNRFELLFDGFGRFGTSLCTRFLVELIIVAWLLPIGVLAGALFYFLQPGGGMLDPLSYSALQSALILLAVLVALILRMRYGLALYAVAEDPAIRAREAVRRSATLMEGNYWRLGLLWLRFVGWQFLTMLTLGVGMLWLAPYMATAMAAFYDDLSVQGE